MTKTRILIVVCFVLAFAAGAAFGIFVMSSSHPHPDRGSWLTRELNLSPEQQEQMRKIWERTTEPGSRGQRAAAAQQRDDAMSALLAKALTEDEQAQYKAIQQDYSKKLDEVSQARKQAFDQMVEQTKKILTPEQAAKYDELMKRQRERGGEGDRPGPPPSGARGGWRHRGEQTRPGEVTRPAAQE